MFFQKRVQESITKPCVFGNWLCFIPVMSPSKKCSEDQSGIAAERRAASAIPHDSQSGRSGKGSRLHAYLETKAERILEDHGFIHDGSIKSQKKVFESINKGGGQLCTEKVCQMIEELNGGQEKEKQIDLSELHETFEDPRCNQSKYFH